MQILHTKPAHSYKPAKKSWFILQGVLILDGKSNSPDELSQNREGLQNPKSNNIFLPQHHIFYVSNRGIYPI